MRNRLILLPGWGLGTAPLEPLAEALRGLDQHMQVHVEPLPLLTACEVPEWLDELDATLPEGAWLGGWSLGGMLATELAARRGDTCPGLITLASNSSFVTSTDWPHGMPEQAFDLFRQGCAQNPQITLKRFASLCAQGAADPRAIARLMLGAAPHESGELLLASLDLLAELDTRDALQAFFGPQLHLYGGQDSLVPAEVAGDMLALLGDVEIGLIDGVSHAFALERPHEIAAAIEAFLHEAGDD